MVVVVAMRVMAGDGVRMTAIARFKDGDFNRWLYPVVMRVLVILRFDSMPVIVMAIVGQDGMIVVVAVVVIVGNGIQVPLCIASFLLINRRRWNCSD